MEPALAQFNCRVSQSTSDAAPRLLAYVEHSLEAHHAPDVFPGQRELGKAGSGPMATKEWAAPKAVTEAPAQLERLHSNPQSASDKPEKSRPGRSPQEPMSLEHAEPALETARREHARLAEHRAQVTASIRGIGHDYHCVELERGVRRNGPLIYADMQDPIKQLRTVAHQEERSQRCLERIDQAERVVPKMRGTIAFVSRYIAQQVTHLNLTPPVSFAMHAKLMPLYSLGRVAEPRTASGGEPLRARAERRRAPLVKPGGALSTLSPEARGQLHDAAKRLAPVFPRSSSKVEGRNGYVSLRNHQLRGLDLPRKRECFTAIHNIFLTRPDGTTAAERFFGRKPRSMFAAILESGELAPAPLSPPRKA
jgi:hypothetical protein